MSKVMSIAGSIIGLFLPDKPYWAAKRHDGKWLCELDTIYDVTQGRKRPFDWTLDMVSTGDIHKLKELWMFCPPNDRYLFGQSDRLEVTESDTMFQLKIASMHAWGEVGRQLDGMLIGRVTDKETGVCDCKVWDARLNEMGNWSSSIYDFKSWRDGIADLGNLSQAVLGLNLS